MDHRGYCASGDDLEALQAGAGRGQAGRTARADRVVDRIDHTDHNATWLGSKAHLSILTPESLKTALGPFAKFTFSAKPHSVAGPALPLESSLLSSTSSLGPNGRDVEQQSYQNCASSQ